MNLTDKTMTQNFSENDDIEAIKLANKKLDMFSSHIHFGLSGIYCKLAVKNRGELFFSINNGKDVLIGEDGIKKIDAALAKYRKESLEGAGCIYLVSDGTYTKIGATTFNPTKRLNELQVGNASELVLVGSYHAHRRIGTEKMLHKMFHEKRIRGEWFDLSGMDISQILNNKYQFSNGSEFQVLSSEESCLITEYADLTQKQWSDYASKIRMRLANKLGKGQVFFEKKFRAEDAKPVLALVV